MDRIIRLVIIVVCVTVLATVSGCFLPFFGGDKQTETNASKTTKAPDSPAAQQPTQREQSGSRNPTAAAEAVRRAEQAMADQKYETAVIEYNRALRADSTNVEAYLALTRLHRQLSEQYREAGKLDEALRAHMQAVSVLSTYFTNYLEPEAAARASTPSQNAPPAAPSGTQPAPSSPPP